MLADRTRLIGTEHVETLTTTRDYLVWALGRAGRLEQARKECAALLNDRLRLLGPRHPHTLNSRYRQAWLERLDGNYDQARAMCEGLLVMLCNVLGEFHVETMRCRGEIVRRCGSADSSTKLRPQPLSCCAMKRKQASARALRRVGTSRTGPAATGEGAVARQSPIGQSNTEQCS